MVHPAALLLSSAAVLLQASGPTHPDLADLAARWEGAMPACGVAVLESFKRGDCTVSDIRAVRVPSGRTGSLPIELTVAEALLPGVYYLAGGLMVGGRVQFFRRPLHIGRGRA